VIEEELRKNPNSRRAVLSMWDASYDGANDLLKGMEGCKDVPCNTHAYFDVRGGRLNMTVCNRSNDAIWGAYGANVVHFSILQEYLANCLDVPMGVYRQFSNNLHAYTGIYSIEQLREMAADGPLYNFYGDHARNLLPVPDAVRPSNLISTDKDTWDDDLIQFTFATNNNLESKELNWRGYDFEDKFFTTVAAPVFSTWWYRKHKHYDLAKQAVEDIAAEDWRLACRQWIQRADARREEKNA